MTDKDTNEATDPQDTDDLAAEATAELAKADDVTAYAEERSEQDREEETGEPVKKASRYERLKRARDSYKAEADELRRKLEDTGPAPEQAPPENPYEEDIERGRRDAESAYQQQEHDQQVAEIAALRTRAEFVASQYSDWDETISTVRDLGLNPPQEIGRMIARSQYGPQMLYALAKDAISPEGQGLLVRLQDMAGDPVAQAREFGRMEAAFDQMAKPTAQRKATSAPAPIKPVKGGASVPKDLTALAASDDASDYIRARRRESV